MGTTNNTCDPGRITKLSKNLDTPQQRPTNENTNGLLREYFPKGTDLSIHSQADLDYVEWEMNDRPRKRLDFLKPAEVIEEILLH